MPKINNDKLIKNTQIYKQHLQLKQDNSKNILNDINTLMSNITKSKNYDEYIEQLEIYVKSHTDSKFTEDNTIQHSEYIIKPGLESNIQYYEQIYPALKRKGITLLPEYIKSAKTKEGFSISLFKIDGLTKNNLLDFEKNYKLLSEEDKQQAYKNIKELLNIGIVNPLILQDGLKIVPNAKNKIICTDWENLQPIESYISEYGNDALQNLTNQYYMKLFK